MPETPSKDREDYTKFLKVLAGVVGAAFAGIAAIVVEQKRKEKRD